jgi:exosome complex exonuclease RRP6
MSKDMRFTVSKDSFPSFKITKDHEFVIDVPPLINWVLENLQEAFENSKIIKVLHGCDNDVRWLQRDFDFFIHPVIEMQVLIHKSFRGESSISLANACASHLGIKICKEAQTTDWTVRDNHGRLPEELFKYASQDTHMLLLLWNK